jgi:predicted transcriptional regulator of viral defense system
MKDAVRFPADQMLISTSELKEQGLTPYKIRQLVNAGVLNKLNKKYYENTAYTGDESDFLYAFAYAPDGVICLMSAAVYYDLTTYRPDAVNVAIERKARVPTLPVFPELNISYYTDDRFNTGIREIQVGKNHFRIYDLEKTVVDIVYYREKVGIEETKEILINYLRRDDRDLNRLIRYAEKLKCGVALKTYLEVLV